MIQKYKTSLLEILFNVLFFMVCIIFLFTIFFIFSPFSDANYFPRLSQYIEKYFWAIYSGPIIIALLCFIKKRLFSGKRAQIEGHVRSNSQSINHVPEPIEVYKHDA